MSYDAGVYEADFSDDDDDHNNHQSETGSAQHTVEKKNHLHGMGHDAFLEYSDGDDYIDQHKLKKFFSKLGVDIILGPMFHQLLSFYFGIMDTAGSEYVT